MNELHLVVIPIRVRMLLIKYCEENKIKYEIVSPRDFPEGTSGGCTFRGVDHLDDVTGFESELAKEEVYNILEKIIPPGIKFDHHNN